MSLVLNSNRLPMIISFPSTVASLSIPPKLSKFDGSERSKPSSLAFYHCFTKGMFRFCFSLAAYLKRFGFSIAKAIISVTSGLPLVSVPVLSKRIVSSFSLISRASPFLTRIPSSAPRPIPTVTAVGVARPNRRDKLQLGWILIL